MFRIKLHMWDILLKIYHTLFFTFVLFRSHSLTATFFDTNTVCIALNVLVNLIKTVIRMCF